MMPASQLSSDDLRNVRQALLIHNSLNILIAIKLILGWDVFVCSAFAKFERRENVRSEFSSCLDAEVSGVYSKAEVAVGGHKFYR